MDASTVAQAILALDCPHPVRVGIDGPCGAGKTTLADAVAVQLRAAGRTVIRATGDDFQNPPEVRWQLGPRSPEGFFRHQIDFAALRSLLLDPLGSGGARTFHTSSYDVHASLPHVSGEQLAGPNDVLLLDGLFLHAPALRDSFDLTVYMAVPPALCLSRWLTRQRERVSGLEELEELYREKYLPGFSLYCEEFAPETQATIVVSA